MKTPHGRYVKAQMDLQKWLSKLLRAAKEVDKLRRAVNRYERQFDRAIDPNKTGIATGVKAPRLNVWGATNARGGKGLE